MDFSFVLSFLSFSIVATICNKRHLLLYSEVINQAVEISEEMTPTKSEFKANVEGGGEEEEEEEE